MKLDSTRVDETIAFINNNANFPAVRRQAVAQFCRQTYPRLSLLDFGPYHNEFHTLSGEMSVRQHATVPAGNQADRAKRRAILLIWKSVVKAFNLAALPAAQPAMAMPTGNLDAALADAILKAWVYAVAQRILAQGIAAGMANAAGAALNVFGRGAGNAPAIAGGNPFYPNANLRYATIIGHDAGG
jgi:hypothetical protein